MLGAALTLSIALRRGAWRQRGGGRGGDASRTPPRCRALLAEGKDVNAAQGDGMTALHWAAMHGDAELTATLLYAGANVRATTRLGGYTALHLAAQAGQAAALARVDCRRRQLSGARPRPARRP